MHFQACSLGLSDKFEQVKHMYYEADKLLGSLIKVSHLYLLLLNSFGVYLDCQINPGFRLQSGVRNYLAESLPDRSHSEAGVLNARY